MNKIAQIKIFNGLLDQFFDFLEQNFPYYKSDVVLTRTTVEFVRKSNPRLVAEQFVIYVSPYKREIMDCNESFFLNYENNLSNHMSNDNILMGMKIKNMWLAPETTDVQKAHIWMYIQKLLKAGEKIFH
jgi:hypothetical protein